MKNANVAVLIALVLLLGFVGIRSCKKVNSNEGKIDLGGDSITFDTGTNAPAQEPPNPASK